MKTKKVFIFYYRTVVFFYFWRTIAPTSTKKGSWLSQTLSHLRFILHTFAISTNTFYRYIKLSSKRHKSIYCTCTIPFKLYGRYRTGTVRYPRINPVEKNCRFTKNEKKIKTSTIKGKNNTTILTLISLSFFNETSDHLNLLCLPWDNETIENKWS